MTSSSIKQPQPCTHNNKFNLFAVEFSPTPPIQASFSDSQLKICEYINAKLRNHAKKQAKILAPEQVLEFCRNAPNSEIFVRTKLIVLFGVFALAREQELSDLRWDEIKETSHGYEVVIHRRKIDASRSIQHVLVSYFAFEVSVQGLITTYKQLHGGVGAIWVSEHGKPLSRTAVARWERNGT